MKTGLIFVLLGLLCSGCRKAENHDITVWRLQKEGGLRTEIGGVQLSEELIDRILQKATQECNDITLIVCLSPGVSVTNAFALLAMAEGHGITDTRVRMNQTPPPQASAKENGVAYDVSKRDAPTGKRPLP